MSVEDVLAAVKSWKSRVAVQRLLRAYYEGDHPIKFATPSFKKHYKWVLEGSQENLCEAVVDAFVGPITVTSWQGGDGKTATELAKTWSFGRLMNQVHDEAWTTGDSYVLVWPDRKGQLRPWYHESDQGVVMPYPGTNELRAWAKIWLGDGSRPRVNVYYEDRVERWFVNKAIDPKAVSMETDWPDRPELWLPWSDDDGGPILRHTFGEVPVAWMCHNQIGDGKQGRSVLRNVIPLQDALNHSLASLIVGTEAFAQPLRLLLGITDDEDRVVTMVDGQIRVQEPAQIKIDPTQESIVGVKGDGVTAHEFTAPDLTKLVAVQDAFAGKISRIVGLPSFDLTQSTTGTVPSGAALRVLRERKSGLVTGFEQDVEPEWVRVFKLMGAPSVELEWADVSPLDPEEQLALITAKHQVGYPFEELLIDFGESPDDIRRILAAKKTEDAEALRQAKEAMVGGDTGANDGADGSSPPPTP